VPTGTYVEWVSSVRIHGELATTDSNGQSVCITSPNVNLTLPTYYYTGPINTAPVVVVDGTTVTDGLGREFLDLTSAYPDEEVFKQCKYIQTGPPPVFLTPVNSIKLPQSTLPKTSNSATTTSTSPVTSPTTSAKPATPPIVIPSPTTTNAPPPPEESDDPPSMPPPSDDDDEEDEDPAPSPPEESDEPSTPPPPSDNDGDDDEDTSPSPPQESDNTPNPPPPSDENEDDDDDDTTTPSPPQESDNPSSPSPPSDNDNEEDEAPAPSPTGNQGTSAGSPQSPSDAPAPTSQPANSDPSPSQGQPDTPANSLPPSDDTEPQNPEPTQPSTNSPQQSDNENDVPGNTVAPPTTATQPSGIAPIAPVTVPAPGSSTTPILGLPSSSPPDEDNEGSPEIIVGGSTTIVAGGGVAVGSGTTFSVLPSSSGIVAIADGSTSTLPVPTAAPNAGGDSDPPVLGVPASTPQGVVVGGSTTIVAGGDVAVGSGTTFFVLPSSSGIIAVADGSTSTLPLPIVVPSADAPQGVVVGGSTTIVAGGGVAVGSGTTFSVLPSSGGIIAIADGRTSTLPLPTAAPTTNDGFVQPITSAAPGFVLPGQTVSEGGEAVAVGGTSFYALPSGSGIVAISEGGSTTLQSSQLSDFGISRVADNSDAFVLPSQTLAVSGSAAIIDGATYSALPGSSGINVASDGQTSTIAAAEATSIPGVGEITQIDDNDGGFVLDGSVTVLPGGTDATVSGTVYSALPSGFGVLVTNDSDEFASYIEQGISSEEQGSGEGESYVTGVESLSAGQATTVSGVVYSVLPSGSGVLVVANGQSTTLEVGPTPTVDSSDDEGSAATTTGGSGGDESVAPYTGGSTAQYSSLGSLAWIAHVSVLGFVGACLVL
jgi:hypothetical protein